MFVDPEKTLDTLNIIPGMSVADFGCGSGYYTISLSRRVSEKGSVYAVDIQKSVLDKLSKEAEDRNLDNVEFILGDIEKEVGSKLADNSMDAVIVSNILFQIEDKEAFVREVARIIKKGGKALIVDWADSFGGLGPQPEYIFPSDKAKELFEKSGLKLEREFDPGAHHFALIFNKT